MKDLRLARFVTLFNVKVGCTIRLSCNKFSYRADRDLDNVKQEIERSTYDFCLDVRMVPHSVDPMGTSRGYRKQT